MDIKQIFYAIAENIIEHVKRMPPLGNHAADAEVARTIQDILEGSLHAAGFVRIEPIFQQRLASETEQRATDAALLELEAATRTDPNDSGQHAAVMKALQAIRHESRSIILWKTA